MSGAKMTEFIDLDTFASQLRMIFLPSSDQEPVDLKLLVLGDHWKDKELIEELENLDVANLSNEWISEHSDSLPCLSSQGLRLILPQFAIYSARNLDTDVTDCVISTLARLSDDSIIGLELRKLLSTRQRVGLGLYLRAIENQYPMTRVMRPYIDVARANWPASEPA